MASIRFRSNKWQARVFRQGQQALVKTFYSKEDAQRWARSIEVEWDKGTYTSICSIPRQADIPKVLFSACAR